MYFVFAFYKETNGISFSTYTVLFFSQTVRNVTNENPFTVSINVEYEWMSKLNLIVTISLEPSISVTRASDKLNLRTEMVVPTPNATVISLGGLLCALGFFGLGPATGMIDEIVDFYKKKKDQSISDQPELHHPGSGDNPSAAELKRKYTYTNNRDAREFVSHPFQPLTKSTEEKDGSSTVGSWLSFLAAPRD